MKNWFKRKTLAEISKQEAEKAKKWDYEFILSMAKKYFGRFAVKNLEQKDEYTLLLKGTPFALKLGLFCFNLCKVDSPEKVAPMQVDSIESLGKAILYFKKK